MVQALFEQLSTQLNFLLLSQRQMVLLSAFGVALASYANASNRFILNYFALILFSYAIAVGVKSTSDFSDYIEDVRKDTPPLEPDELRMVERSAKWVNHSYVLFALISLLLVTFIFHGLSRKREEMMEKKKK
jgi:hypothetical protein